MCALKKKMTAAALVALVAACGCTGDDELVEVAYFAEWEDVTARVWIPTDEPRSIGTYRAEVNWPGGTTDRLRAERDGMITGVWLHDLESDGALDVIVALSSAGSGSYGTVHVYRHEDDGFVAVPLVELTDADRAGYMGHDTFSVEGGRLRRTFPRYAEGDPNAAPSGGEVRLYYSFDENAWIVEAGSDE
jgi:hypothetical protein